jgi:hypothetical protein
MSYADSVAVVDRSSNTLVLLRGDGFWSAHDRERAVHGLHCDH